MASQRDVWRSRKKLGKGGTFLERESGTCRGKKWMQEQEEEEQQQQQEQEEKEEFRERDMGYKHFIRSFLKRAIRLEAE